MEFSDSERLKILTALCERIIDIDQHSANPTIRKAASLVQTGYFVTTMPTDWLVNNRAQIESDAQMLPEPSPSPVRQDTR